MAAIDTAARFGLERSRPRFGRNGRDRYVTARNT
jgi:hypothetical protein